MRVGLVLFFILASGFILVSPRSPQVRAWGLATHMWMVDHAINAMPEGPWKVAFEFFASDVKSGSITPDVVWQDWDNHLYYPETGEYTAHLAVGRYFDYVRDNFTIGSWEEGMLAAGILSHYFSDPNIPVHTDILWDGHEVLETDINNHLDTFNPIIGSPEMVANASQLLIDAATIAHQFYDDCVALYPTGVQPIPNPLETNATFHGMIETQLERAIFGIRNLWYTAIAGLEPPDLPSGVPTWTILIDTGHNNVYTSPVDQLTSFKSILQKSQVTVLEDSDGITADDLTDIDLLIITPPCLNFTDAEISIIADWLVNGTNGHLLLTAYSEHFRDPIYYPNPTEQFQRLTLDHLLANCTSHIQLNDDSVYHVGTPSPWYVDLTDFSPGADPLNLTFGCSSIRMYSPCSLWFTDTQFVNITLYGDPECYQSSNVVEPPPVVIWDNVNDNVGGDQIPLMAGEIIGDSRLFVAGTTFFSDFDYGATDFSNDQFTEQVLEWLFNASLAEIDVSGPIISGIAIDPAEPEEGQPLTISATISDPAGVENATLYYHIDTGPEKTLAMVPSTSTRYSAIIPGSDIIYYTNITFHIKAYDSYENWRKILNQTIILEPGTTPTITDLTPPPLNPIILGVTAATCIIVIILVIWFLRRRRSQ